MLETLEEGKGRENYVIIFSKLKEGLRGESRKARTVVQFCICPQGDSYSQCRWHTVGSITQTYLDSISSCAVQQNTHGAWGHNLWSLLSKTDAWFYASPCLENSPTPILMLLWKYFVCGMCSHVCMLPPFIHAYIDMGLAYYVFKWVQYVYISVYENGLI